MAVQDISVRHYQSTMPGATSLSGTAGAIIAVIDSCISSFGLVTLTSLVVANNIATATVNTGHGFVMLKTPAPAVDVVGPVIEIAGSNPTGLNGKWRIKSIANANTFTFEVSGVTDQTASGTITAKIAGANLTKIYSGTNTAAYQFDNVTGTRRYLRIDDSTTTYCLIKMYETMSDINTGANGTGNLYFVKSSTANSTARPWRIFLDDFYLHIFSKYDGTTWASSMHFGDAIPVDSADAFYAHINGHIGTNSSDETMYLVNNTSGHYMMRSYTQSGAVTAVKAITNGLQTGQMGTGPLSYPQPNGDCVVATVYLIQSTNVLRGIIPGLYCPLHAAANFTDGQIITNAVGSNKAFMIQGIRQASYCVAIDIIGPWR